MLGEFDSFIRLFTISIVGLCDWLMTIIFISQSEGCKNTYTLKLTVNENRGLSHELSRSKYLM